jgi:hypothetical protein
MKMISKQINEPKMNGLRRLLRLYEMYSGGLVPEDQVANTLITALLGN